MIRVRQIKIPILNDNEKNLKNEISKKVKTNNFEIVKILHKSIDARNKENILYVYDLVIDVNEKNIKYNDNILKYGDLNNEFVITGKNKLNGSINIIGLGPAGLFCGYMLAKLGYKVNIFERGKCVEERKIDVENFWNNNKLIVNSNVVFGEGGAGTFSDGKLNTNIKGNDDYINKVLSIFVENGANEEILYINKPHLGTDALFDIVKNMRNKIKENGGNIYYNSALTNIFFENNKLTKFEINNKDIYNADFLILAIGHSAKDTFKMLYDNNINMTSKPFAVGVRIMHDQKLIDNNQYGSFSKYLPPAEYKLTYTSKNKKGVYSFCMCPGGYVVNSSSEKGYLNINGMSYSSRNSGVANSAIIVSVSENDYGRLPLDGIKFQEDLERKAYKTCKGFIPVQTYKDFKNNEVTKTSLNELKIKGKYNYANLNNIFPKYICDDLKEAIDYFNNKIKGFNGDNIVLAAVESRTSCPVKFLRDDNMESNIRGLFVIGEGSGYAGGITTSAIEGLKMAKYIMENYKN